MPSPSTTWRPRPPSYTLAADAEAGVIILIGAQSYAGRDGDLLLAAVVAAAARSEARACIELDHCDSVGLIESALAAGAGAVMADGSALPYEHNVAFIIRAVQLAASSGASVEAELGAIRRTRMSRRRLPPAP